MKPQPPKSNDWIEILPDHSNIPWDDEPDEEKYLVWSPLWDATDYGAVTCHRLAVMTGEGRGSVTHFKLK